MAEYTVYIEASAAAIDGTVTGTGLSGDPYVGRGDDVWKYVLDNVLTTWGAGVSGNPAWALGDRHVVNASNKEAYLWYDTVNDNLTFPSAWANADQPNRFFDIKCWETTTRANSGTFQQWPDGEWRACVEFDGQDLANAPLYTLTTSPVRYYDCYHHSFTRGTYQNTYGTNQRCIVEGMSNMSENSQAKYAGCWIKGNVDSSDWGLYLPRSAERCLFEGQMQYYILANSYCAIRNSIFKMDSSVEKAINLNANCDYTTIEGCIFIGSGVADQHAIESANYSGATTLTIRNNLFINFNGSGSHAITERSDLGSNSAGAFAEVDGNFYYNCNANDVTEETNAVTLTKNPLLNPGGYDFRLIEDPLLQPLYRSITSSPFVNFAPWGLVRANHRNTFGGIVHPNWANENLTGPDT